MEEKIILLYIQSLVIFIFGLIIGSFLNVCIYRLPRKLSIFYPARSFCPACKTTIKWYDNIPVISYFILSGKCRHCNSKISLQYPIVEFITGLLFVFVFIKFGLEKIYFYYIILTGFILLFSFIDIEKKQVLNELLVLFIFIILIFNIFEINHINIFEALSGFIIGGSIIYLLNFLSNGKIGEGDIKLFAAMGLATGLKDVLYIILYSFLVGGLMSAFLVFFKNKKMQSKIPFVPFIAIAFFIRIFLK